MKTQLETTSSFPISNGVVLLQLRSIFILFDTVFIWQTKKIKIFITCDWNNSFIIVIEEIEW